MPLEQSLRPFPVLEIHLSGFYFDDAGLELLAKHIGEGVKLSLSKRTIQSQDENPK